ncbi:MAG TPA: hypothetical protein VFA50_02355 [Stellaceae bacterium]|nr:hypothetical protein [Stellaceae bacterium]
MRQRKRRAATPLSVLFAELALASWETMARRGLMMAQGRCSRAEYRRMLREKAQALCASGMALAFPRAGDPVAALLAPWHRRAAANARRLRRKRR